MSKIKRGLCLCFEKVIVFRMQCNFSCPVSNIWIKKKIKFCSVLPQTLLLIANAEYWNFFWVF